jgi:nitrite reductase/ring-hydroxylating ferredoxin subunit
MDVGNRRTGEIVVNEKSRSLAWGTSLCARDEIPDGGAHEIIADMNGERISIVVLRKGKNIAAYINHCPHFHIPLNFAQGAFLISGGELWCTHHSATFRFEDGYCTDGPCRGGSLDAVPITETDDGMIVVDK